MSFQDDSITIFFNQSNTHATEFVAGVDDDGFPIRLLLLTEKDYAIKIVISRLSLCMAPKE